VEFTIAGGEMTPTMKMKRKFIEKKYTDIVGELYQDTKL